MNQFVEDRNVCLHKERRAVCLLIKNSHVGMVFVRPDFSNGLVGLSNSCAARF